MVREEITIFQYYFAIEKLFPIFTDKFDSEDNNSKIHFIPTYK